MHYWISADYHINHANIISYVNRPFKTLEEMNQTIITNHNSRVKDEDWIIHNGDFMFRNSRGGKPGEGLPIKFNEVKNKFNGNFIFVRGNHDNSNSLKTIVERLTVRYGGKRINIVHDPEFVDFGYEINLTGHVHNHWQIRRFKRGEAITDCVNVGCDVWGYKPVSFEEIFSRYAKWKKQEGLK